MGQSLRLKAADKPGENDSLRPTAAGRGALSAQEKPLEREQLFFAANTPKSVFELLLFIHLISIKNYPMLLSDDKPRGESEEEKGPRGKTVIVRPENISNFRGNEPLPNGSRMPRTDLPKRLLLVTWPRQQRSTPPHFRSPSLPSRWSIASFATRPTALTRHQPCLEDIGSTLK